jgi:hypothetical protein
MSQAAEAKMGHCPVDGNKPSSLTLMPAAWNEIVLGIREMEVTDVHFMRGLINKYGLRTGKSQATGPEGPRKPFGRPEFFAAVGEVKDHIEKTFDATENSKPPFPEEWNRTTREAYEKASEEYPLHQRFGLMVLLFSSLPQVHLEASKLHDEKMARAYPYFIKILPEITVDDTTSASDYIYQATSLMTGCAAKASEAFNQEDIENVAFVWGFKKGVYFPQERRKGFFAALGVQTFEEKLAMSAGYASLMGDNVAEEVAESFGPDGINTRQMRLHIWTTKPLRGLPPPFVEKRLALDLTEGTCPAYHNMRAVTDDPELLEVVGQQIAYTYATAIIDGAIKQGFFGQKSTN